MCYYTVASSYTMFGSCMYYSGKKNVCVNEHFYKQTDKPAPNWEVIKKNLITLKIASMPSTMIQASYIMLTHIYYIIVSSTCPLLCLRLLQLQVIYKGIAFKIYMNNSGKD